MKEQRRFARVAFDGEAVLEIGGRKLEVVLVDLSLRGAMLELPPDAAFGPGTTASLTLALDDTDIVIPLECRVSHAQPGRIGVEFTRIDVDAMQHLRRLVELNLGGDAQLRWPHG